MQKITAPRGTQDILPLVSAKWRTFETRAHAVAARFGYGEIRTPMFESTELFVRGVGETTDIVEKEMYTFVDKGDRSMTLRPEWTAPVVRACLERGLLGAGSAQRLYYVGPFFRYERPQAGRYRQAHQFGVECFGYAGAEADVEAMHLAHEVLASFAVPGVRLAINSIGDEACRPAYREALLAHFRPHAADLSADSQRRLERNPLRILDSKAPQDRPLVETAPTFLDVLCTPCAEHFAHVRALLEAIGIPYRLDPRLVRGFDYYGRTVFEFISDALGAQATICGGGRYDGLVASLGGPPTPAVGFGMGIERFLMVLDAAASVALPERTGLAVIALGEAARTRASVLAADLRRTLAVPVAIDYGASKLATQLKRADALGLRAAIVVGDDELAAGVVLARDLTARTQETIADAPGGEVARAVGAWYGALDAVANETAVRA